MRWGCVALPIAAKVKPVAVGAPGGRGDSRGPTERSERRFVADLPWIPARGHGELRGDEGPDAVDIQLQRARTLQCFPALDA